MSIYDTSVLNGSQIEQQTDRSGVARRGPLAVGGAALTIPHISPLHLSGLRIENSSVKYPQIESYNLKDYRYLDNDDVNLVPVYIPQFNGSVEIWAGASLVIIKRPPLHKLRIGADRLGGGLRGFISGFSDGARLRMIKTLGKIVNSVVPVFVTLTYPDDWPHDSEVWKRHLDTFFKRVYRQFPGSSALWKLEPQKRGAPHYHLLVWGAAYLDLLTWVNLAWFEVVGSGDSKHLKWGARVQVIRSWRGVQSYASKYLGKLQVAGENGVEAWRYPGRWWGIYGRNRMPWGECIKADLDRGQSIRLIRVARKYMEKHSPKFRRVVRLVRGHFDTLSIISHDAVGWFNRLDALIC